MRAPASLLHRRAAGETSSSPAPHRQEMAPTVDSDAAVILASLLCMLVCVLGLALLSRCACRRRGRASSSDRASPPPPPKGLGAEAIDALPTVSFAAAESSSSSSECAICLAEFAQGEGVRVLPRCGHGFHFACIDAWLRKRPTCPSCRGAFVAAAPVPTAQAVVAADSGEEAPHAGGGDATFIAVLSAPVI